MNQTQVIDYNKVTIFPLGFRGENANLLHERDALILVQKGKVTHLVEVLDKSSYQEWGWYHRLVKVLCWKPHEDWWSLPSAEELLGFEYKIYSGRPYPLENLQATYGEKWESNGGLQAFKTHLSEKLRQHDYII
ncbi:hypothetical protein [Crocosphaera sp.]|uniref:hypothetical protein n=1 Tax=Crocosphaera sp. TaxID=2729996 RepID=UPI003F26E759|nr:hypothetical protein [Crocosphaera sp.]